MTVENQRLYDTILSKIYKNYEDVSLEEFKRLSEVICSRYSGGDLILDQLSNEELIRNMDYFARSYFELAKYKKIWGVGSKHYILSNLYKSSHGLSSESRRKIFIEKEMFIEQDNIGFGNRSGFAHFKFFVRANIPYLLLVHEYGYNSITNKVEELVSTIDNDFLHDIGFDVIKDEVQIYYKDTGSHYEQVTLQLGIKSPEWRSLEVYEQVWFDQTWDTVGHVTDERSQHAYFFEKGKQFDAYNSIMDILANVKKELIIVDNYIDSSLFLMLGVVPPTVSILILTSKMHGDASVAIEKFKAQRGNFEWSKAKDFHDRYIFADEGCYLLGASIKDFANKATTLVAIKEKPVIKLMKNYAKEKFEEGLSRKFD
ncbi:hypothetical protein [Paenibacillus whitsoniae]|uniref:Uncharacterized protein n=1 Tax=Paenibacillus whitsoniae TaxID=2496558 RepID=A0A430J533_9BACL|nr:hypothetical protein [Paenibacillus whitsoniae]RTE02757.1 hypothetical protein EJQ19_29015 [Paenibacillus whitsoniae]